MANEKAEARTNADAATVIAPPAPCGPDPDAGKVSTPTTPYELKGPQVEPASAFWLEGSHLPRVVPLQDVLRKVGTSNLHFPQDKVTNDAEISELADLAR